MHPEERRAAERQKMVERQIAARGIDHPAVLQAMRRVERDRFVPTDKVDNAYDDGPLAIGSGQTISQPYIVALMTQLSDPKPHKKALDICTGCGSGAMKAPMKGAAIAHSKQRNIRGRYVGISEPGIIAAESPNPIVNELIIMPDMEKRLTTKMGFKQVGEPRWLVAWDISSTATSEEKKPRRRRIRAER